jgi:hypothetical protein
MKAQGELIFLTWDRRPLAAPILVDIPPAVDGRTVIEVPVPAIHEPSTLQLIVHRVERELPVDAELRFKQSLGACQRPACAAMVLWLRHPQSGRLAPVDANPAPNGNIVVDLAQREYSVLAGDRLTAARRAGTELRLNHWVTCEDPPRRRGGRLT